MKTLDFRLKDAVVKDSLVVTGIVYMDNGCCHDKPVLVTANRMENGKLNFSCQCACGMWCTTGHPTSVGALRDYQTMSNGNVPMVDDYKKR